MKKLAYSLIVLSLLVLVTISASATDGNLIVNGGFEASSMAPTFPDVPSGTWTYYEIGSIGGWTVEHSFDSGNEYPPRLEVWDNLMGPAADGDQHVELDGYDPTKISQTPSTTMGYCYELSYAWSPRPNVADNQMKVYVGGEEVAHHSASGVGNSATAWNWETYQFQATSTSTTIAFAEVGPDDQLGMLLDAVSLTECAPVAVGIDIKPGSDPNCFNSDGHGVIPVAILGSADFDASTVDPFTVLLNGAVVRVKGKSGNAGSLEDVNGDGFQDLVVQIVDDSSYTVGDTTATLSGVTYDGVRIVGTDTICIRPPE